MLWRNSQIAADRTLAYIVSSDWSSVYKTSLRLSKDAVVNSSGVGDVEVKSQPPLADYFSANGLFIVSERLKLVFEDFAVHAEFLQLRLVNRRGIALANQGFYCCNILDAVDCFDHSRGECTFHETPGFADHIDKIKKMAIDEEKAAPYHLFRLAKGGEHLVFTSNPLAEEIAKRGLTGMRFIPPEDWPIV